MCSYAHHWKACLLQINIHIGTTHWKSIYFKIFPITARFKFVKIKIKKYKPVSMWTLLNIPYTRIIICLFLFICSKCNLIVHKPHRYLLWELLLYCHYFKILLKWLCIALTLLKHSCVCFVYNQRLHWDSA